MNTFKWLLRREYWEHKGGVFWAPLVVSVLTVILAVVIALAFTWGVHSGNWENDGVKVHSLAQMMDSEGHEKAIELVCATFVFALTPLLGILFFVMFFYFIGSLYDDRADRSILFWKSLPVSDRDTVLSKLATGLVGAPLSAMAIAGVSGIVLAIIALVFFSINGVNLWGAVLGDSRFYTTPFEFLAALPVYILWALPTAGWLMMVSAWAKSKPFVWAVVVPVVTGALISWAIAIVGMFGVHGDHSFYWQHIAGRGLLSILPGSWGFLMDNPGNIGIHIENDSPLLGTLGLLKTANLWIGAIAGAAMIEISVRLRRYRDEG